MEPIRLNASQITTLAMLTEDGVTDIVVEDQDQLDAIRVNYRLPVSGRLAVAKINTIGEIPEESQE